MNVDKQYVMRLNAAWQVIGVCTIADALVAMNSSSGGKPAAVALNLSYPRLDIDSSDWKDWYNWSDPQELIPTAWEDWVTLPVRDFDVPIGTVKHSIRAPIVIIAPNYNKMPMRQFRPTTESILIRDNYTCQYTGQKLPRSMLNIDHKLPKSRGGKDDWTNLVACSKEINTKKGNKTNDEAGLKLIREPRAPLPVPVSHTIREEKRPEWRYFLNAK